MERYVEDSTYNSTTNRPVCLHTGKTSYTSKQDARKSLVGQLASKSIRVYLCSEDHSHYHITKERMDKITHRGRVRTSHRGVDD